MCWWVISPFCDFFAVLDVSLAVNLCIKYKLQFFYIYVHKFVINGHWGEQPVTIRHEDCVWSTRRETVGPPGLQSTLNSSLAGAVGEVSFRWRRLYRLSAIVELKSRCHWNLSTAWIQNTVVCGSWHFCKHTASCFIHVFTIITAVSRDA